MEDMSPQNPSNEGQGVTNDASLTSERPDGMEGYVPPNGENDSWVPEEAIEALNMEKQVQPSETNEEMAERIFEENLPVAAQAICHLARNSGSEKMRFDAAKYVVERNLGRVVDPSGLRKEDDPLMKMMKDVTRDVVAARQDGEQEVVTARTE